jgi:hypothetical protein
MGFRGWSAGVTSLLLLSSSVLAAEEQTATPPATAPSAAVAMNQAVASPDQTSPGWTVEFDPIYVWAPVFVGSVTLPESPSDGGGGGTRPSGKTGASLNSGVIIGFRVEKARWEARGSFLWAGLSGTRELPRLTLSADVIYAELFGGRGFTDHLFIEAGVRRLSADLTAAVDNGPAVSRKPGLWDPLLGASLKFPLGDRWNLMLHGDGGGFGVGSDVDVSASAILDWHRGHFGATLGYQGLYFRLDDTVLDGTGLEKTLTLASSLNGPIVGFRILF